MQVGMHSTIPLL